MGQPFGAVIPVTGLNIGFRGQVSRTNAAEPSIAARQANAANKVNIQFGDPVVLVPDVTGGTYVQVGDWITNSSGLIIPVPAPVPGSNPLPVAGVAIRQVKTQLGYPVPPGTTQIGYYIAGQICEVLERGSICVQIYVGTPAANQPVYLRILADSAVAAGLVGQFEAAADVALATTMTAASIGASITVASAGTPPLGVLAGQYVSGFGIAPGTYVTLVSGTTISLSQSTTAIIPAGTPVTFAYTVQVPDFVFSTGAIDANNMAEITILRRSAS